MRYGEPAAISNGAYRHGRRRADMRAPPARRWPRRRRRYYRACAILPYYGQREATHLRAPRPRTMRACDADGERFVLAPHFFA